MKSIWVLSAILLSTSVHAQWKKLAEWPYPWGLDTLEENVHCVYFLDLPGPPRIGFVGTEAGVYKTTDGGTSWKQVWKQGHYALYAVSSISFKDTLTGWFTILDGSGGSADTTCYRTTDGGSTWKVLQTPGALNGSNAVYYKQSSNSLFLSTDSGMLLSTDLGDHWKRVTTIGTGGISFFDASNGIAEADPDGVIDTVTWFVRTTNGGLSWDSISAPLACDQPLAIPGTSTCFANTSAQTTIWRSDDYGQSWSLLKDFGFQTGAPYADGVIEGTISRLYILTDQGMYFSTDQGITWNFDSGSPGYSPDGERCQTFYCAKGVTMAGSASGASGFYTGGPLWEEFWPTSSVSSPEPNALAAVSAFPDPTTGPVTISGAAGAVTVTNVLGEQVAGTGIREPGSGDVTLDLSRLPAGAYFVRIETAGGMVVRKILKE